MTILHDNNVILEGFRDLKDGLWKLNINSFKMNYVVKNDSNLEELAKYLHVCAFSPVISSFEKCIKKGKFITWPGIDNINF